MQKPHIKILDRYIIRKFLGTFIFTILVAVVIVIVFSNTWRTTRSIPAG